MPANKHAHAKLQDLKGKLRGAQEAAAADDAGDLAKADLKLLEQEVVAEKLKAKRPDANQQAPTTVDGKLDKALKDSFPGSDPVSFVEAAPIKDADRDLPTVPTRIRRTRTDQLHVGTMDRAWPNARSLLLGCSHHASGSVAFGTKSCSPLICRQR